MRHERSENLNFGILFYFTSYINFAPLYGISILRARIGWRWNKFLWNGRNKRPENPRFNNLLNFSTKKKHLSFFLKLKFLILGALIKTWSKIRRNIWNISDSKTLNFDVYFVPFSKPDPFCHLPHPSSVRDIQDKRVKTPNPNWKTLFDFVSQKLRFAPYPSRSLKFQFSGFTLKLN